MVLVVTAFANLIAIGLHTLTWWMRRHRWLKYLMAVAGLLAIALFVVVTCIAFQFDSGGSFHGVGPPTPADWRPQMWVSYLKFISTTVISLTTISFFQKKQIPANWALSTLFVWCEGVAVLFLWLLITEIFRLSWFNYHSFTMEQWRSIKGICEITFGVSVVILALLRPAFLVMLKSIEGQITQKKPN